MPLLLLLLGQPCGALHPTLPRAHRPRASPARPASSWAVASPPLALGPRMSAGSVGTSLALPLLRDPACALVLALLAKVWVALWGGLAKSGTLPSTLTRKLIHTGTGPLFVMGWPFFSDAPSAVLAACSVPLINLARLWLAGKGGVLTADGDQLVSSLSRTGEAKEVARGPFFYTLVLLAATALSFRALPGVVAVCQMAVGDGVADIVGRRLGKTKWGFVENKTVEGSVAFVLGAWGASLGMLGGCHYLGYTSFTVQTAALPMLLISLACSCVELFSAPLQAKIGALADDNLTVPLVGAVLTVLLLRG
ncbi:hypothetical protein AB1Y20_017457 [Prymnesium parvum]|uniref:Dolichol kinase n=1 Tax=Prymnesium parvum TaxID=97485 RepID=A0AB34JLP3_PRYPA